MEGIGLANAIISLSASNDNTVTPPEPATDDVIRKVNLDKLITRNSPPALHRYRNVPTRISHVHEQLCRVPRTSVLYLLPLISNLPRATWNQFQAASMLWSRVALADAMKQRLIEENQPKGQGVNDSNRNLLGARKFFFDQERIPVLEEVIAELMIENMGIDDKRPVSFTPVLVLPGQPIPDRVPMITWLAPRTQPLGLRRHHSLLPNHSILTHFMILDL